MFSFLSKSTDSKCPKPPLKGFKVSKNNERNKKYGIAANSLEMLKTKISLKFNIANFELFADGCLLEEEYFALLPANSIIIIGKKEDEIKSDAEIVLDIFRKNNYELLHARDLFKDLIFNNSDSGKLVEIINLIQNEIKEKTLKTNRIDDEEWFAGLDAKIKCKEDLMRRKGQDRIRGYFYKTKDELTKSKLYRTSKGRSLIDELLADFFLFLNGVEYFSCLFDRTHDKKFVRKEINDETDAKAFKEKPKRRKIDSETKSRLVNSNIFKYCRVALCDNSGQFKCHGLWNSDKCLYEHRINPYASREAMILFSIFNLDHQIEISRSIFPSILENVEKLLMGEKCSTHENVSVNVSVLTYFKEIFTVKNLKLVHIVCHDKASHDTWSKGHLICVDCDEYKKLQNLKLRAF